MTPDYVHGYDPRESLRLQDQAATFAELLHSDTVFLAGSRVLEAGCGVGAQTATLAKSSPGARILAVDISSESLAEVEPALGWTRDARSPDRKDRGADESHRLREIWASRGPASC